jgi:hypothetical protein
MAHSASSVHDVYYARVLFIEVDGSLVEHAVSSDVLIRKAHERHDLRLR